MKNYLPSQVIAAYNPTLQAGIMSAFSTIIEANHAENVPKIRDLAGAYDESVAVSWIQHQLLQVNEFAGVKSKLSDMQLRELSIQICLEYGALNLFEFILFCARLRSGKYEDFYGSVDPMRILKSLGRFYSERGVEIAKEIETKEKEEKELAESEHAKRCISLEDWYQSKTEEERGDICGPLRTLAENAKIGPRTRPP